MATLTLTEYGMIGYTGASKNQYGVHPGVGSILAEQTVSLSSSTAQCSALQSGTSLIEICSDTDCYLAFGINPIAVANYHYLPAKTVRYYAMSGLTLLAAIT